MRQRESDGAIKENLFETIDIKGRRYKLSSRGDRWFGQFLDGLIYLAMLLGGLVIASVPGWDLAMASAALLVLVYRSQVLLIHDNGVGRSIAETLTFCPDNEHPHDKHDDMVSSALPGRESQLR